MAVTLGAAFGFTALARLLGRRYLRVAVAGESMTPALLPEDFLVLRAGPPAPEHAFGQIVALHDPRPEGDGRLLLKRVIGLPGESLRIGGAAGGSIGEGMRGGVQVNGQLLHEPWAHGETPHEQHRGINRLEAGQYFLLGDNRGASTDSRDFGPVSSEAIVGTALLRYWPPDRLARFRPPRRELFDVAPAEDAHEHGPAVRPLPWLGGMSHGSGRGEE